MDGQREKSPVRLDYTPQDRMELYQLLNDCVAMMRDSLELSGDDWMILRHIELGNHENKPYDLTTLSQAVSIPRTTVSRRVGKLVEVGFHERVYEGRRATFRGTDRVADDLEPVVHDIIDRMRAYADDLERRHDRGRGLPDSKPAANGYAPSAAPVRGSPS